MTATGWILVVLAAFVTASLAIGGYSFAAWRWKEKLESREEYNRQAARRQADEYQHELDAYRKQIARLRFPPEASETTLEDLTGWVEALYRVMGLRPRRIKQNEYPKYAAEPYDWGIPPGAKK